MKIQIDVQNLQKRICIKPRAIASKIKKILHRKGVREASLSVAFVTDQRIKALNKKFLNANYATDVLAFDFLIPKKQKVKPKTINGEIVISTHAVCRQAKIFHASQSRELTLYIIHGILHLLGFDDHRGNDIKRMRAEEKKLMEFVK